jgi:fimbrial isopeptide formation D2 family protein/uncharacterized repeat protein (TIGR01451 family)
MSLSSTLRASRFSLLGALSRGARRRKTRHVREAAQATEALELRALLAGAPVPTATLDIPPEEMINESFDFTVTFDNTSANPADVGYVPYVDLSVPDGIDLNSANYLGSPVSLTPAGEFDAGGNLVDSGGAPILHPLTGLAVTGTPGETLFIVELPFGSFVPDQPPAEITIVASTDATDGAVVGTPIDIDATGGFALGCDPLDNAASDPPIIGATDTDSITPQVIDLIKTGFIDDGIERATGPSYEYEYELAINIADGETVTNIDLADFLPNSFVYVAGSVNIDSSNSGGVTGQSITETPVAGAPQNAPDNDLLIEFATATGTTSERDIVVTYSVWISNFDADGNPVIDPDSGDQTVATNESEVTGTYPTGPVGDNDSFTDTNVEQSSIATQKSVAVVNDVGGAGPTPGDTLEWTIDVQVSDYFEFSNIVLDDTFTDGQRFDTSFTPTFVITEGGVTTSGSFAASNFDVTLNSPGDGTTDIEFDISGEVPDGVLTGDLFADMNQDGSTTVTVTFRTVIQDEFSDTFPSGDSSVDIGDVLSNTDTITGELPSGLFESDSGGASVQIDGPSVSKEVYAIDGILVGPGEETTAGRDITYRITLQLPTSDAEDLVLTDYIPLPFYDATTITTWNPGIAGTVPPSGTATYGPLHTLDTVVPGSGPVTPLPTDAVANTLQFDFGSFDVDPSEPSTIDILFTLTGQDVLMADGLTLQNQVLAEYGSTNSGEVSSSALAPVTIAAPELVLSKGVVSTDAVSPTFDGSTVGPVAFAAPGSAGPAFGGGITSTTLDANPIDSNLVDADAGDLVKFAIAVENNGGAQGFNLVIQDVIPAEYIVPTTGAGLNLQVSDGDGNAIPFTGNLFTTGIDLTDGGISDGSIASFDSADTAGDGSNVVIITYDLELAVSVEPDQVYTNTAELLQFGAIDGGNNHTLGSSNPDWSDDATVETLNFDVAKSLVTTSEIHTGVVGGIERVTIGEIVRYRLSAEIPEGTMTDIELRDLLPGGLQFLDDGTATAAFIANGGGIVSNDITGALDLGLGTAPGIVGNAPVAPTFVLPDVNVGSTSSTAADPDNYGSSVDPYFKFGQIVNSDNDADSEFIVVEFNALVLNQASTGNDNNDTRTNSAQARVGNVVEDSSNSVQVRIAEPLINNVNKTVTPATGDAGDTVSYTVTFSNSTATTRSTAWDVNLLDTLPSDVTLDLTSITVTPAGGTSGITDNSTGNTLDIDITQMPLGGSVTVEFDATLNTSVQPDELIVNTAKVSYSSLPGAGTVGGTNTTGSSTPDVSGADTGERDGSGAHNDYCDQDSAQVRVASPLIAKTLVGTSVVSASNANDEAVIGETVQYRVTVTLPEGTINEAEIIDALDAGLSFVSLDSITTSAGVASDSVDLNDSTTISVSAVGQNLTFDLGNIVNSNSSSTPETIVLTYTALVQDIVVNQGDANPGDMLSNSAAFGWTESGTAKDTPTVSAPEVEIIEPNVDIAKVVSAGAIDAGDQITYTITIDHNTLSDTDAFDLTFSDVVPSVVNVNFATGVTATHSTGGDIKTLFELTSSNELRTIPGSTFDLLEGETVTIEITGTIGGGVFPGQSISNTGTVDWTSIDGADPNERDGDDGQGGALDDYEESSTAAVSVVAEPSVAKDLIGTSIVTLNNANTEAVIGETIQYRVTVTVPEAVISDSQLVDNLDVGLEFVSLDSVEAFSAGIATADLTSSIDSFASTSSFNPTTTGDGIGAAQELVFDFGTLTNANNSNADVETLVLTYTVRVLNVPGNTSNGAAAGQMLNNAATLEYTAGGSPESTNTDSADNVEIIEPELEVLKSIDDETPHLGQTVTYTLTIQHTAASDADAHDIVVGDTLPSGMTLDVASINVVGAVVVANTSAGNNIDLELDGLADGSAITITYDATITTDATQIGANLNNTADTTWTSLPDGATSGATSERDGDGGNGGEDDYTDNVNETAVLTHPQLELEKDFVDAVPASSGVAGNFDVTYDFTITSTGNDPLTQVSLLEDVAMQYGGAFRGIVLQSGAPARITTSTATDDPEINSAYDGGAMDDELFDNSSTNVNSIAQGQSVTIRVIFEVDPNDATAMLTNGDLVNQAIVTATGADTGVVVSDLSDDPDNPTDADGDPGTPADDDGNPDDPNTIRFPNISLQKETVGPPVVASSGTAGNFDIRYRFTINNTGSTDLDTLVLNENLVASFGTAFVRIVPQGGALAPAVITSSSATDDPGINGSFDATAASPNIFDASAALLEPNQMVEVEIVVELDPDATGAIFDSVTGDGSGDFENQAEITAEDPSDGTVVDDNSDDPSDMANNDDDADNDPDDPTTVILPNITLTKTQVGNIEPATSGTAGNWEVTYDLEIINSGGEALNSLSLVEDLQAHYGGAFVGLVTQSVGVPATIQASTATNDPEINAAYTGMTGSSQLFDNSGSNTNLLEIGEAVTVRIVIEVDPDEPTATLPGGIFENQAAVEGTGAISGVTVDDESDDPTNMADDDGDADNDPDDPNQFVIPDVTLTKQVSTTTPPSINSDGTWSVVFELQMTNTGSTVLDNLQIYDNLMAIGNLGATWVSTDAVTIDNSGVTTGDNAVLNAGWVTDPSQNILTGAGSMNVGDTVGVTFTVTIDPDVSGASSSPLLNQAIAEADDPTDTPVSDPSDDPVDNANADPNDDNNPDDPTAIEIADIGVSKQVNDVIELGTNQFRVEYVVVVENTGTVNLSNIDVTEDINAELGAAFESVFAGPTEVVLLRNFAAGSVMPTINTAGWDGTSANSLLVDGDGTDLMQPGDSFVLVFTVDLDTDPGDDTGAPLYTNTVRATADGANGQPAADDSDDGTNPNSDGGDGNEDTPTPFRTSQIRSAKTHGTAVQNADGTYTVPVTIRVENTGNVDLTNLTLFDDVATEWGNAYIGLSNQSVNAVAPFTGTLPLVNPAWNTTNTSVDMINGGAAVLLPNEAFEFTFDALVDPDAVDSTSDFLSNQAEASGDGENHDGTMVTVSDESGNESSIDEGVDNDEPTPLIIPEVILTKRLISSTIASSETAGNLDAVYEFVYENTGTVTLQAPTITDDWNTQFGAMFVGVVDMDLSDDTIAPGASGVGGNAAYTGAAADNLLDGAGQLLPGEIVTVRVTIEVDPDAEPALLVDGELVNQAEAEGTYDPDPGTAGDEIIVGDDSDDPDDDTDNDTEADGEPDDPTTLSVADVELTKVVSGATPAASGTVGNFDVTYTFTVTNTGSEALANLSVTDDFATQFGGAFVSVLDVQVVPGTATVAPVANNAANNPGGAYDGTMGSDMLLGSPADNLRSGEFYQIILRVEIDPDNAGATYNASGDLENTANTSGDGEQGGSATDVSDDTNEPANVETDGDNEPDDPTTLILSSIELQKSATSVEPASSGTAGNYDVTYEFTFTNNGNEDLTNLTLTDDWVGHFGSMFVRIVDTDLSNDVVAPFGSGIGGNAAYTGGATQNIMDGAGTLNPGLSVTVTLIVEVDPDADTTFLVNGTLENSASVSGTDPNSTVVSDISDDPTDGDDTETEGDNDPDSPTNVSIADIDIQKIVSTTSPPVPATSGVQGNFDVTYEMLITNTGTETLSNLSLTDNLTTQFGTAFVDVVSVQVINIDATVPPADNDGGYDGTDTTDMLSGGPTDDFRPAEQFRVILVVELDPDAAMGVYNAAGELENSADVSGDGENGGMATDVSDDSTNDADAQDPTDPDNDGDDPTAFSVPNIELEKTATSMVPAFSGAAGNYDITYQLVFTNTGNEDLSNLTLTDDWLGQFDAMFVGIVDTDLSNGNVVAPVGSGIDGNNAYTGGALENMLDGAGTLASGETVTVTVVVEVDPDAAPTFLVNGTIENTATVTGTDPDSNVVADISDDPSDTDDAETEGDNDPDSPTNVSLADIDVEKIVSTTSPPVPATSGTAGNFDVTYEFVVTNTGTEALSNLSLTDDLATQFGTAFVDVVSVSVVDIDASNAPTANNGGYDGTAGSDMLIGAASDDLRPAEQFRVILVVELDPDSATGVYNTAGQLENSADVAGDGENGGTATDVSDDTTDGNDTQDPTDPDNDGDDPTTFSVPDIELEKTATGMVPALSGTAGNYDVTYELVFTNTGNEDLNNLTLTDNWAGQFGNMFVRIVDTNLSDGNVVAPGGSFINGAPIYNGGAADNMLDGIGVLASGESVTVTVVVEVDPDADTGFLVNGTLENIASVTGTDPDSNIVSDTSDDPTDADDTETEGDNDPDSPTNISIPDIDLQKVLSTANPPVPAVSGAPGNFDVTYEFLVENTGTDVLSNLSLTDDLATQFGQAFVDVVSVTVINIDATNPPTANNGGYNGTAGSDILIGTASDDFRPTEQFRVVLVVEIDPDNTGAVYNADGELQNSADVQGDGENGGTATDVSDDTSDDTNAQDPSDPDNDGDDPTTLIISDIELEKQAINTVPALSGTPGNYDITYEFVLTNTGNDPLTNLTLTDDWMSQFGAMFVGVVDTDLSDGNVVAPGGSGIGGNNNYLGVAAGNMLDGVGTLQAGDSVIVTLTVEVDTDADPTFLVNGTLQNSAEIDGLDSDLNPVTDASNDPTDGDDIETDGDNEPDSPTNVTIPEIDVEKVISPTNRPVPAASGTIGNFDVTYEFLVSNTGTETLSNISLTDDLAGQLGGAFINVLSITVVNIDATSVPAGNNGYTGIGTSDMLNGSSSDVLEPSQSFRVVLEVEIDPNNEDAIYNGAGALENSAEAAGDGDSGTVTDISDDTTDPTNAQDPSDPDNDGDDPTELLIGSLELEKTVSAPRVAASGVPGHFDLTYTFVITSTGNDVVNNLTLIDDWATHFGSGYITIADTDLSNDVTGSATAIGDNNYTGGGSENMFAAGSTLGVGEVVTMQVVVTVNPSAPGAILPGGKFINSADVSGVDSDGDPAADVSDDPTDPANVDTNGNSDPDDPTEVGFGEIGDFVWFDLDGDGTYDPATEIPYPGVEITIKGDIDGDGINETFTTTTDANGMYLFEGLPLIEWTVCVTNPPGTSNTFDDDGGEDGESTVALVDTNFVRHDQDFGLKGDGSIGDTVFLDSNGNGVQNPNEIGIPGVTVSLDIDIDGDGTTDLTVTTTTDQDGNYLFDNLPKGTYDVTVNPPLSLNETSDLDDDGNPDTDSTVVLGAGRNNLGQDFGFVGGGTIGDTIFMDINHNGEFDTDEGIGGVTVELKVDLDGDGFNETITTVTNGNGQYLFDGLPTRLDYIVKVDQTTLPVGVSNTVDPDGGNNSRSELRINNINPSNLDQDFGYAGAGVIGDTIFADLNNNGVADPGEGLAGVTVEIKVDFDGDGQLETFTTVTDANGNYEFECLPTGLDYLVKVIPATLPPNMQNTVDPDGDDPNRSEFRLTHTRPENHRQDFGYRGPGEIGDTIFLDHNHNGQPDPDEGIAGVVVELKYDLNGNGTIDTISTVTDSNGHYLFSGLPFKDSLNNAPMLYKIKVDKTTLPAGLTNTIDPDGGRNSRSEVTLDANNRDDLHQDFGYAGPGSIGDVLFADINGNGVADAGEGLSGVTVEIMADIDGDGQIETFTTVTDANGMYLFECLPVDDGNGNGIDYRIRVDQDTLPPGLENTFDPDGSRNGISEITLTPGAGSSNGAQDFGYQGEGRIGDTIFLDINDNGVPDPGEELAGVSVELVGDIDGDGNTEKVITTTDSNGQYSFIGLPVEAPGGGGIDYTVKVDKVAGAVGDTLPADVKNTVDPHRGKNSISELTLTSRRPTNDQQDFGYRAKGEVGDRVFLDVDGDGKWDSGEGISGVEVTLTGDFDNDGIPDTVTTTTGPDGQYQFTGLPRDETYIVRINPDTVPATYVAAFDPDGGKDLESSVTLNRRLKRGEDFGFLESVDLTITKDNTHPNDLALSGEEFTYEIVVTNNGPGTAHNARVVDRFPNKIVSAEWKATGTRGTKFNSSGTGDIVETVIIPKDGQITYTVTVTTESDFTGNVRNQARIRTNGDQVDTNPDDNIADDLTVIADMNVRPLGTLEAGNPETLSSRGHTNDTSLVNFYVSRSLGSTPVPGTDLTLGLENAQLIGTGFLCDADTIEAIWNVPANAAGQTWYLQTVESTPTPTLSNVQPVEIGSSGSGGSGRQEDDSQLDGSAYVSGHILRVRGTNSADEIEVEVGDSSVRVVVNGEESVFDSRDHMFHTIDVQSDTGRDSIVVSGTAPTDHLHGGVLIQSGDGNDTISVSDLSAEVRSGNGNDSIVVAGSLESRVDVQAEAGDDEVTVLGRVRSVISGGDGHDTISGGEYHDVIRGDAGADLILGNGGNDVVEGGSGQDVIRGGRGRDILLGNAGNDNIRGGSSHDLIVGGNGSDDIAGGRGDDLVISKATAFDHDSERMRQVRRLWNTEGLTYSERADALTDSQTGLLRTDIVGETSTDSDSVLGGDGLDLFFASLQSDSTTDLNRLEQLFDTDR